MATHLITFGGGKRLYRRAVARVVKQTEQFGCFDGIKGYSPDDLDAQYDLLFPDFAARFPRGFGLWSWKPYLINRELGQLNEGDLLVYVDSGCELNHQGQPKFQEYIEAAEADGIYIGRTKHRHMNWCKKDPLLLPNAVISGANQVEATWMILKNTQTIRDLVSDWLALCALDDGRLLQDPGGAPQDPWFKDHRHDQACLHVVLEQSGLPAKAERTNFPLNWLGDAPTKAKDFPVLSIRNRRGRSAVPWLRESWLF